MLSLLLIIIIIVIIKAVFDGIKDGIHGINKYAPVEKVQETPYYIDEQIQAILEQIQAYHSIIDRLEENINLSSDLDRIAVLEKRKADNLYKAAKLEEKLQKLLEKWDE